MQGPDGDGEMGSGGPLSESGPDWNGSWRNVEYVRLGVGWKPPVLKEQNSPVSLTAHVDQPGSSALPRDRPQFRGSSFTKIEISHPSSSSSSSSPGLVKQDWDVEEERRKYLAKKQLEIFQMLEARAGEVARQLRALRDRARGRWIEIDVSAEDS